MTFRLDPLEPRTLFNAAFDLIGLTALRGDPQYSFLDGSGTTVAVLDTGLDHADTLISPNYRGGTNIVTGGADPTPTDPHGTHVAGIIGATDPEIGVATHVGLVAVQVFEQGSDGSLGSTNTDIHNGLQWVLQHRAQFGITVVNMSLGEGFFTNANQVAGVQYVDDIRQLESAGVTVVSAAGNSFFSNQTKNSSDPGVVSTLDVGAVWKGNFGRADWADGATDFTTGPDRITSFSQRPNTPNAIFAPGAIITSTLPGNKTGQESGTSQASPTVAGCVALLQQAAEHYGGRLLRPGEVASVITSTADQVFDGDDENDNVRNTQASYPRINILHAVRAVQAMFGGAPSPGGNAPDANGTLAGAIAAPTLSGSPIDPLGGNIGTDGAGSTIGATDVDVYAVPVTSAGVLSAATSGVSAVVRIFDASGNQLATGATGASVAVTPGTYYVGVSGAGNSAYDPDTAGSGSAGLTGDYSLQLSLGNADPNGTIAGAVQVDLGNTNAPQSFQGNIGTDFGAPVGVADVDMFKVTAPDNGTLRINIDTPFASGFVDSYLRVFDASGTLVNFNDDALATGPFRDDTEIFGADGLVHKRESLAFAGHVTDSFLSGTVNRGDVFYVAVADASTPDFNPNSLTDRTAATSAGGLYDLSVTFDSSDANGTIDQVAATAGATEFDLLGRIGTDPAAGGGTVDVGDRDVDFIKITSPAAGIFDADVNSTTLADDAEPFDATLSLFDASGNLLATNDDRSPDDVDPHLAYQVAPDTDYYLAVAGFGNAGFDPHATGSGTSGDTGVYELVGHLRPLSDANQLADDSVNSPAVQTLGVGQTIFGRIGDDAGFARGATDVDLYRFTPSTRQEVRVFTTTSEKFDADTFLRLFDAAGHELAFNDDQAPGDTSSAVSFVALPGQTYYIGVTGTPTDAGDPRAYDPLTGTNPTAGHTGTYGLAIQATGSPIPDAPDLTTTLASVPQNIQPNTNYKATVLLTNAGTLPAKSTVRVNLYASTDDVFDSADLLLASTPTKVKLGAGARKSVTLKFPSPNGKLPTGQYRLIAVADTGNALHEIDESNNTSTSFPITITAPTIDLAPVSLTAPDTLTAGKPTTVTITLKNIGNTPAKGAARFRFFASSDKLFDPNADLAVGTSSKSITLKQGKSTTLKLKLTPGAVSPGQSFLLALLDYTGTPTDSNLDNNTVFSTQPITFV